MNTNTTTNNNNSQNNLLTKLTAVISFGLKNLSMLYCANKASLCDTDIITMMVIIIINCITTLNIVAHYQSL